MILGDIMESNEYVNLLNQRFSTYYDTVNSFEILGETFDFYARYYERNERYIASKKVVIYGIEQNEHILYKYIENLRLEDLKKIVQTLENSVNELVKPSGDHMATLISGVIGYRGEISQEIFNFVKKYKFYKSFRLGLNGWVNIGLHIVNLDDPSQHYCNKRGKEGRKNFSLNLEKSKRR